MIYYINESVQYETFTKSIIEFNLIIWNYWSETSKLFCVYNRKFIELCTKYLKSNKNYEGKELTEKEIKEYNKILESNKKELEKNIDNIKDFDQNYIPNLKKWQKSPAKEDTPLTISRTIKDCNEEISFLKK